VSAALVAAIEKLTERITRLEKAARQPERVAYRPSEVAAMLGVKPQTVRELIHEERIQAQDMGGWYLITAVEVSRLLGADQRVAS
jgi:excisionase family DNA binding protein